MATGLITGHLRFIRRKLTAKFITGNQREIYTFKCEWSSSLKCYNFGPLIRDNAVMVAPTCPDLYP